MHAQARKLSRLCLAAAVLIVPIAVALPHAGESLHVTDPTPPATSKGRMQAEPPEPPDPGQEAPPPNRPTDENQATAKPGPARNPAPARNTPTDNANTTTPPTQPRQAAPNQDPAPKTPDNLSPDNLSRDNQAPGNDGPTDIDRNAPTPVTQTDPAQAAPTSQPASDTTTAPRNPTSYGFWTIAPALVAILLAMFTRQVVPALVIGLLVGAFMMRPCLPADAAYAQGTPVIADVRLAFEHYLLGAIHEVEPGKPAPDASGFSHLKILVFTLVIGFMVGVIGRNGGTAGLVRLVAGNSDSKRRGALTTWFAGLVVFFDDYANTMIIGPTMRSVFDRLRISRANLAYIIDSTAAPIASIALIGTWVGTEIGYIDEGLNQINQADMPAYLVDAAGNTISGMSLFISSIPYRFYPILALFFVFLTALTGRHFGPMRKAEERALRGEEVTLDHADANTDRDAEPRWLLGLLPVLVLVGTTVAVLAVTGLNGLGGYSAIDQALPLWEKISLVVQKADSYLCIYYGALAAAGTALLTTVLFRACPLRDAADAGLDGMSRMFPAIAVLVLAWSIGQVEADLQMAQVIRDYLTSYGFQPHYMPLAIFVASAGVSFATGSSWATMALLCPTAVTLTVSLATNNDLPAAEAQTLLYAAVGSVLAGAIFGDHCSPISDTTVLSSIAAGCRHEDHVWTQMPYAVLVALVAIAADEVACGIYEQPWYVGLAAAAVFLVLFLVVFGRRPLPPMTRPQNQAEASAKAEAIAKRLGHR